MRRAFILMLMAATAATPIASASAQNRGRDHDRAERPSRVERPQRAERAPRAERAERPVRVQRAERAPRAYVQERRDDRRDARIERRNDLRDARIERRDDRRDARNARVNDRRDARIERRDDYRDARLRQRDGYDRSGSYDRNRGSYDRNRGGYDRNRYDRDRSAWNRGWRNDRRYDWQRYRASNRHLYRLGRYYSPYRNHHYSRFSIGLFLGSAFYGSNYWINDPWYYRLPPAYPGTRWVRYYDDVMLVDTYTGEVLDVIYDFFW